MLLAEPPPEGAKLRSSRDGGVFWLSEADLVPRGRIPGSVEAIVAPWGIPVPREEAEAWAAALRGLGPCHALAAYHGLPQSAAVSVAKHGLWESKEGMLGRGVYLTHFWRAAMRYAMMEADYKPRACGGAVARAYVFRARMLVRDGSASAPICECGKCRCPKYRDNLCQRRVADHLATWRRERAAGVHVPPCRGDTVDPKTGETRWLARSDEWCCRGELVEVQEIMRVDPSSYESSGPYVAGVRSVRCT